MKKPEKIAPAQSEDLEQTSKTLEAEILSILKKPSDKQIEALQLAALENKELLHLYKEAEKLVLAFADLGSIEDKLKAVALMKELGEISEKIYNAFAIALFGISAPEIVHEAVHPAVPKGQESLDDIEAEIAEAEKAEAVELSAPAKPAAEEKKETTPIAPVSPELEMAQPQVRETTGYTADDVIQEGIALKKKYPDGQIPEAELKELRRKVMSLKRPRTAEKTEWQGEDEYTILRNKRLGGTILARAEEEKPGNIKAILSLIEILLGKDQADLLRDLYVMYHTLARKTGYRLAFRDRENNRPFATLNNYEEIRKAFKSWLENNRDKLSEQDRNKSELVLKRVTAFLGAKGHETIRAAIAREESERHLADLASKIEELEREIIQTFPQNKSEILKSLDNDIQSYREKLVFALNSVKNASFAEAESSLNDLLVARALLASALRERIELAQSSPKEISKNLTPEPQSRLDLRIKVLELKRKELVVMLDEEIKRLATEKSPSELRRIKVGIKRLEDKIADAKLYLESAGIDFDLETSQLEASQSQLVEERRP